MQENRKKQKKQVAPELRDERETPYCQNGSLKDGGRSTGCSKQLRTRYAHYLVLRYGPVLYSSFCCYQVFKVQVNSLYRFID